MKINFILIGEGTSDTRLTNHIENILIEEGFSEASGEAPDLSLFPKPIGRSVKEKFQAILKYYPHVDVIFIHRDSDNTEPGDRLNEILNAAADVIPEKYIVPIIPVTMLETWLLADIDSIKRIAGKPNTNALKCLPPVNRLENERDAKSLLLTALCQASETQGTRLQKFKSRFYEMRARLTTDLDVAGPVNSLPSYKNFRKLITDFSRHRLEVK